MKNAIVLALVSLASVNAFAAPMTATIKSMDVDNSAFGGGTVKGGYVTINSREATLTLYRGPNCLPGRACSMIAYAPLNISLQIVSRKTDTCHAVVYTAMSDNRMVDGIRQVLTITDNENVTCAYMRAVDPVSISYETDGQTRSGHLQTRSTFVASPFVRAMN